MNNKKKFTLEQAKQAAREFQKKHNRPPRSIDFSISLKRRIYERYSTWNAFIEDVLGETVSYSKWSDEKILEKLREMYGKLGRFPTTKELARERTLTRLIYRRFGDSNTALEKAMGKSPRTEILRAINALAPPGVYPPTAKEILSFLVEGGNPMNQKVLVTTLKVLSGQGFVKGGNYDRTRWWDLTRKGREFLKQAG